MDAQKRQPADERDQIVDRLQDFLRLNYITTTELARRLGVRDGLSWILFQMNPGQAQRRLVTSTSHTHGRRNERDLARSVAKLEARLKRSVMAFEGFARIAGRWVRGGRAKIRR